MGSNHEPELFDLIGDPAMENNVAEAHPKTVTEMREPMVSWLQDMQAPAEALGSLVTTE